MPETLKSTCAEEGGNLFPVIDRNRCEGKEDCVRVCPYGVFAMDVLSAEERAALSWIGRARGYLHGYRQARVVQPDACHACALCVPACPEKAIKLRSNPLAAGDRRP